MHYSLETGWLKRVVMIGFVLLIGVTDVGVAQPWEVGDTTSFWAFDFHFFMRYYRTQMTLQAIGEYCYVWTEDTSWARGLIDPDDVAALLEAFDEKTPAADDTASGILSDTRGIYDMLTSLYGEPPDIDEDPRIHVLILDCTEGIGAAAMPGYFDPVNELTQFESPYSNQHEMIYVDCDPFDTGSDGRWSAVQQFTHLLQYGNDPDEECWITEGLSCLSQFVCGYGVANPEGIFSREPLTFSLRSVMTNCREQPEQEDQVKTAMFMQYLFERYGIDLIRTLATDTEHSGPEAVTAALAANGYSGVDFDSVFVDEQLAWFMDSPEEWFYEGKYSFTYYESGAMFDAKMFTYWGTLDNAPYFCPGNQWSADFITVIPPAPCLTNPAYSCYNPHIFFYGDLGHTFGVIVIKANSRYLMPFEADPSLPIEFLAVDDLNQTSFDVSGFGEEYETLFLAVIHQAAMDGSASRPHYIIHNEYPIFPPPRNLRAQDGAMGNVPLSWDPPFLSPGSRGGRASVEGASNWRAHGATEAKQLLYQSLKERHSGCSGVGAVAEYHVYGGDFPGGPYEMIASPPATEYVDTDVAGGQTYF